jgi:putative DNA primase/helicase
MESRNDGLILISGDQVTPKPVLFLWPDWLAQGKLHVLAGAAGTGKTSLAIDLAARLTVGAQWPDGIPAPTGNVIIYSQEDGFEDSLVPRLIAAGGDRTRFHHVTGVRRHDTTRPFDPTTDFVRLRANILSLHGPSILIVDPLTAVVSGDSHKNAEVRRGLHALVTLAEDTGCAVIGITHFTKGTSGSEPLERVTGSLAFGAAPRLVWVTAKNTSESGPRRVLCRAKSNIGPDGGGFEFDVSDSRLPQFGDLQTSRVVWGKPVSGSARDIIRSVEPNPDEHSAWSPAVRWLKELLADGPMNASVVAESAQVAGLTRARLHRASQQLDIKKMKNGMSGGWTWSLPDTNSSREDVENHYEDLEESTSPAMKSSKSSSLLTNPGSVTKRMASLKFDGRWSNNEAALKAGEPHSIAEVIRKSGYASP